MSYDCYCDYDPPEWINIETRKARKQYKCEECRGPINIGDSYEYTAGKWEGSLSTFRTCARCTELREWAKISVPCFCWAYGSLHEDVENMVDDVKRTVPGFVFEWGRRMIKIERHRTGRHWPRMPHRRAPTPDSSPVASA